MAEKVTLIRKADGEEKDFDPAHAKRIMTKRPNGPWKYKNGTYGAAVTGQVDGPSAQDDEDCGCGKSGATATTAQPKPKKRKRSGAKGLGKSSGK